MKGIIKKLDEKGFGFISIEGQKDIFFHANDCGEGVFTTMREGDAVSFETAQSDKGPKAVKVVLEDGMEAANNNDNFASEADESEAA
ncbi:MAG: cold shock domain-containing protein [Candidatus Gracilibacteria bacterium]|jgi:CspA family cold shock protein